MRFTPSRYCVDSIGYVLYLVVSYLIPVSYNNVEYTQPKEKEEFDNSILYKGRLIQLDSLYLEDLGCLNSYTVLQRLHCLGVCQKGTITDHSGVVKYVFVEGRWYEPDNAPILEGVPVQNSFPGFFEEI